MNRFYKVITLVGLAALSNTVTADNYAGIGVVKTNYSEAAFADDDFAEVNLTSLVGRIGSQFHTNFSAELRLGSSIKDDTALETEVDLASLYGAYIRAGVPVTQSIYPYAIAGYTRSSFDYSNVLGDSSESETDASFGIGVDLRLTDKVLANLEFMNYIDENGAEVNAYQLGIIKYF